MQNPRTLKIFSYIPKKSLRGNRKNVLSMAFNKNNIPSTIQITPHLLVGRLKGHGGFLSDKLLEDFIIDLYVWNLILCEDQSLFRNKSFALNLML